MAPAGIEPATFRFVAQHLNHCATAVPTLFLCKVRIFRRCLFTLHVSGYTRMSFVRRVHFLTDFNEIWCLFTGLETLTSQDIILV